jgi:circadian clock protein KaiB
MAPKIRLTLFITGQTRRSEQAVRQLQGLLGGLENCQLTVVDVLEHPEMAERLGILATPTLIKDHPPPVRRLIGDLTDVSRVRAELRLQANEPNETSSSRSTDSASNSYDDRLRENTHLQEPDRD